MEEFTITDDAAGKHAIASHLQITVLPDGDSRIFHRNAIRMNGGRERMLVAELDGVRLYIKGSHLIMTTQDLYL